MLLSQAAARSPCGPHANRVYALPEGTYKLKRHRSFTQHAPQFILAHWATLLAVTSNVKTTPRTRAFLGLYLTPRKQQPVSEWAHTPLGSIAIPSWVGEWVGK